ncbi:MAG: hypothetical protein KGJ60_08650 [Verrucomicrobiota bacterium]|nr:hypothetical protein [Verrucomicrobiota bacterium]
MTLNVSLRVPDGIVIASDSLSTLTQAINQKMNITATCEKCGAPIEIKDVQTPPVAIPSSTWPYAQKLFPIQKRFGLAIFGSAFVNSRSMYNHVIELAPKLPSANECGDGFTAIGKFIADYFHQQLQIEWEKANVDPKLQPDNFWPFGFHFVGFAKDGDGEPTAKTSLIEIGRVPRVRVFDGIGCTWSGDGSVVSLLWPPSLGAGANFTVFSLQDAIDYAKFLIRTTADYQRFSGKLPTVGGDIDIALVTNHRGFQWIAQKELYRILDRDEKML